MGGDDILKCKIKNSELAKKSIALQGLTQVELSMIIGISKPYLSQVLNKKRTCKASTAKKISDALHSDIKTQFNVFV